MDAYPEEDPETRALLERLDTGEAEAWDQLLCQHRDELWNQIDLRLDRRLRRRVDPSDVVQEAQLEATRRLPDYLARRPMPLRLWLRKLAHELLVLHGEEPLRVGRAVLVATDRDVRARGGYPLFVLTNWGSTCLPDASGRPSIEGRLFDGLDLQHIRVDLDPAGVDGVTHHPNAQHRVARLHGQAAKEVRSVGGQKEVAARSSGPGQPPRSQEGRRKRRRINQLIPLRSPPIEVGDVQQAGRSHYRISRRMVAIREGAHLTPAILPRPDETASPALHAIHWCPLPDLWVHPPRTPPAELNVLQRY